MYTGFCHHYLNNSIYTRRLGINADYKIFNCLPLTTKKILPPAAASKLEASLIQCVFTMSKDVILSDQKPCRAVYNDTTDLWNSKSVNLQRTHGDLRSIVDLNLRKIPSIHLWRSHVDLRLVTLGQETFCTAKQTKRGCRFC